MSPKTKQIALPFIVLIIAIAIMAGLVAGKKKPEKKEAINNATFVSTESVELAPLTLNVQSQGLVQPKYQTRLQSQVSGEIIALSETFVRGGIVTKGDVLAQIDPFNYQMALQQANATLAAAKAQFILARAQGRVAEAEWEKITTAKPSELGLRKPQQEQALAAVKAAEAGVRKASKDLARTNIRAPFDALISGRNVSPGTFVNIGTELGSVMDIETAEIRLPVSGSDLAFLIEGGHNATVALSTTLGGKTTQWHARIVRDEGVVDNQNRMVYLVAELTDPYNRLTTNNAPRLPFGTYVSAHIEGRKLASAASIPRRLLRDNRLALFSDNKLAFTYVNVVRHVGPNSIIDSGLASGDTIITSSLEYPIEGMALNTHAIDTTGEQHLITAEPNGTQLPAPESTRATLSADEES